MLTRRIEVQSNAGSGREQWIERDQEGGQRFVQRLRQDEDFVMVDRRCESATLTLAKLGIDHPEYLGGSELERIVSHSFIEGKTLAALWELCRSSIIISSVIDCISRFYARPQKTSVPPDPSLRQLAPADFDALSRLGTFLQHTDANATNIILSDKGSVVLVDNEDLSYTFKGRDFASLLIDPQLFLTKGEALRAIALMLRYIEPEHLKAAVSLEMVRKSTVLNRLASRGSQFADLAKIVDEVGQNILRWM